MPEIPYPDPPLHDDEVSLRPWDDADLPALVDACQDPEIGRWTAVPWPYSERDGLQYLTRVEPDRRAGRELGLAIVDAGDGTLLGSCGLARLDWEEGKAEIGYWVAAAARGRGVGTRATRLLSRWGLEELELERLELLANPANHASQQLALAVGYTREGLLRSYRPRKGRREDLVMFSLLAGDLPPPGTNP
jgi:RimJ/RimL family protein N-acetyltransferase